MSERLFDLLHESARAHPERAAFLGAGARTTYAELDRLSARFAAALAARGIAPGRRVVLMIDGVVEYLIAYYGILKAGAIAVPIAPDSRGRALHHVLAHCGASAVVVGAEAARALADLPAECPLELVVAVRAALPAVRCATEDITSMIAEDRAMNDTGVTSADVAAIHYTSGTTGHPKGAMLTHRNLVSNVRSIVEYLALGPEDVAAMVLPFYYVYGSSVLHTHLAVGGAIAPAGSIAFPAAVLAAIQRHRCTGLAGVPSTFVRLLGFPAAGRFDLGSLSYLTVAGAALSPPLADELRARLPQARLFLMYGQTEATARLSYVPPEDLDRKRGSAGRAIPGVRLWICDADGRELPRGELGEVVAQGDNIMRGYWNDPEETARVLRPEGLRTGDIGRMDEDGFVFIAGRTSEIIKSGGRRISPLEIEEVLLQVAGVRECAVVGAPDPELGEAIVAHVVAAPEAQLTEPRVLRACLEQLPRAKVPSRVHFVDALPRTANGKLRRMDLKRTSPGAGTEQAR